MPAIERLGLLWDATTGRAQLEIAENAARAQGLKTTVIELRPATNFDVELRELAGRPSTGIVHLTSPGFAVVAAKFAAAAQKYRLPTISTLKAYARVGVLITYGTIQEAYFPRAVLIADKILKGLSPQDLPIERPDRFELSINMKTAKALGLTIPHSLILRADEVIR